MAQAGILTPIRIIFGCLHYIQHCRRLRMLTGSDRNLHGASELLVTSGDGDLGFSTGRRGELEDFRRLYIYPNKIAFAAGTARPSIIIDFSASVSAVRCAGSSRCVGPTPNDRIDFESG